MATELTRIPNSIAIGAQVQFTMSTAKNISEGGNAHRKSLRPIKRNYMVTISPDDADEIQAIIMAMDGDRYPVAMRDYTAYQVTGELCSFDNESGQFLMGRSWIPSTGTREKFERILVPDDIMVTINGSPASTGSITFHDFGRITYSGMSTGDTVEITGTYLKPVCLIDNPTADVFGSIGDVAQVQFASMRFEELFEAELLELTA